MLEEKISRLAADFAARIVRALTAAPLDELVDLAARPPRPSSKANAPAKRAARASSTSTDAPALPTAEITTAARAFFAERGARGATARQLGEHLGTLGLAADTEVVTVLTASGEIRDAGFRRAAGKNATAPVYVAT